MVHVEIWTGGETGEQSIGARWQRGQVQYFDSYKFNSTSYHTMKYHFKSIDTWLEGICKSHCAEHVWSSSNLQWAPGKNSIFKMDDGYDEADLDAPMLDAEDYPEEESKAQSSDLEKLCFIGMGNNAKLAKDTLINQGYQAMARGTQFSDKYRFKWTQTAGEINFMKFVEGKHICNHFSNSKIFTNKIQTFEMLELLNRQLKNGATKSELYQSIDQFMPETYRLDVVADLMQFLQTEDKGLWLVKNSTSNMGRGIEMIPDIGAYKHSLLTKKDKWGESVASDKEATKELITGSTEGELPQEETKAHANEETQAEKVEMPEEKKDVGAQKTNLNTLVKELHNMCIQKYIEDPCLIDNKKFDIRVLMVIACCKPFFVFSHPGYVRKSLNDYTVENFGRAKESEDGKDDWQGRYTHLTNLSIQKKHPDYKERKEESAMNMDQLCDYLVKRGDTTPELFQTKVIDRINEVMRLIFVTVKDRLDKKFGCFEMFGFDFMLNSALDPKLLEINVNPALFLDTQVQTDILPKLVQDTVNIAHEIHEPHQKESDKAKIEEIFAKNNQLNYTVLHSE